MSASIQLTASRIRVAFVREADRFRHEIAVYTVESWHTVLESIEGLPEVEWPPSPPLQELHVEQRPGGEVALLVGRSGRSHWSLSVESDLASNSLLFDVACRSSSPANRLRSTYRPLAEPMYDLQILEGELRRSAADDDGLSIVPRSAVDAHATRTFRWRYQIAAVP